jgi:uptake hydrogenase large subunit
MTKRIVGPFNRVEGDLEVHLDIEDDQVKSARVNSPLFRGFEQILQGKDPMDALVYAPRICGICSVSQSVAAAYALAKAQGVTMPENGELATNLILANENIADHFTHFYLFFMPDFAREVYAQESWYEMVVKRFKAVTGTASKDALPARTEFLHIMGILAGKWPHSLAIQPGGTTRAIEAQERVRIAAILAKFRRYLETTLFGDQLETIIALKDNDQLKAWANEAPAESSDFRLFLHIADSLKLEELGRGVDSFMSYGVYSRDGSQLFNRGLWKDGVHALNIEDITEDLSHSWMKGNDEPQHPYTGITMPDINIEEAYSWCKAPRLDGQVVEVGALARQQVNGHPLIRALVEESGGNVRNRVVARLLEIALVLVEMENWCRHLKPKEIFCNHAVMPKAAQGYGLVEAARGSLGHWLKVKQGSIDNYQIIAPTTWNFSPRDSQGIPGALEQALVNAPVRSGEKDPVSVQHIVRSFDPCMVCTVH